ncbi:MAG: type II toxin-antitoxin system VapC family toxin [Candidatus Asgardarchaeia archaeon]
MIFLDSNIFLYAYLKPRRVLTEKEKSMKKSAKEILERIESGEQVVISVIHLSEISNIIESRLGLEKSIKLIETILSMPNILVVSVSEGDYILAVDIAKRKRVSINDAVAYIKMMQLKIKKIYTFDEHFKQFSDISISCDIK